MKIKGLFKKVEIKETPYSLIARTKQLTFRTTEYIENFIKERSENEGKSKADIINEILDYEAFRYNKKKEAHK